MALKGVQVAGERERSKARSLVVLKVGHRARTPVWLSYVSAAISPSLGLPLFSPSPEPLSPSRSERLEGLALCASSIVLLCLWVREDGGQAALRTGVQGSNIPLIWYL